jgi:hypothetical protein
MRRKYGFFRSIVHILLLGLSSLNDLVFFKMNYRVLAIDYGLINSIFATKLIGGKTLCIGH